MGSKPDAPDPPDYAGAAQAQGQANLLAALQTGMFNQGNVITPFGSQTTTYDYLNLPPYGGDSVTTEGGGGPPVPGPYVTGDPPAGAPPGGGANPSGGQQALEALKGDGPTPSDYSSGNIFEDNRFIVPTTRIELSPEQQALYDQQNQISTGLNQAALGSLGRVQDNFGQPFDTSGVTQVTGFNDLPGVDGANYDNLPALPNQVSNQGYGDVNRADFSSLQQLDPLTGQGYADVNRASFSGMPGLDPLSNNNYADVNRASFSGMPGLDPLSNNNYADVNRADIGQLDPRTVQGSVGGFQDVYDALMARESDRFGRSRSSAEADLLARGFNPGSKGYEERIDNINRAENDFSLASMLAAGQEQSRLFGLESANRAQGLNEIMSQQQADQSYRGQQLQEDMGISGENRAIRGLLGNEQLQQQQADQAYRGQQFQEDLGFSGENRAIRGLLGNEQLQQQQADQAYRGQQFQEDLGFSGENRAIRGLLGNQLLQQQQADQSFRGQQFQEDLGMTSANAALREQAVAEQQSRQQLSQALRSQLFGEQTTRQRATSDQRTRDLQEALTIRQLPLNELNSLRSGNQAQLPQFQGGGGGGMPGFAPTDIMGALQNQYGAQMGNYNADAAQYNNTLNTGASLLGSYLMLGGFM